MSFVLEQSGIVLRPIEARDRTSLYEAVHESMETVGAWMSWCHPAYSLEDADQWIATCAHNWASGTDREFGIFDAASGAVLGCAGINQVNQVNRFANLGYWIRASRTGQGLASTAARLVAKFGFAQLALVRLEVVVRVNNVASRRVAEKLGCHLEGVARHRLLHQGMPYDAAMYSLLPQDFSLD